MVVDAIMIVAGAILLFLGVQVLIATAIIALSYAIPLWLSLIDHRSCSFYSRSGRCCIRYQPIEEDRLDAPRNSLKLFKEDVSWLKKQVA